LASSAGDGNANRFFAHGVNSRSVVKEVSQPPTGTGPAKRSGKPAHGASVKPARTANSLRVYPRKP